MEALLVNGSLQKGRELILPLSLGGVRVRKVLGSGEQLMAELRDSPAEVLLLAESLPDGPAEQWLAQVASQPGRPLVLILLYGIETVAVVQERCRTVYGPALEVLPAGALQPQQLATQAALRLEQMRKQLPPASVEPEPPAEGRQVGPDPGANGSSPQGRVPAGTEKPAGLVDPTPQTSSATPRGPLGPALTPQASPTTQGAFQQPAGPVPTPQASPTTPAGFKQPSGRPTPQPSFIPPSTVPPTKPPAAPAQFSLVRRGSAQTIALLGATGGVGTSTLTANLAALTAQAGAKVLVVDAGFTTGLAQAYLLGAQTDEGTRGLHHLRWGYLSGRPGTPAEVEPWLDHGKEIALLQLPPILDAIWTLPAEQILWGARALETELDLILIDLGTGIGSPRTLALIEAASQTLLLVGGWGASVQGAGRLLRALEGRPELERLTLLLRTEEGSAWGARAVSRTLGHPIFAQIPTEPLIAQAARQERAPPPFIGQAPDSPYAGAVCALAVKIGLMAESAQPSKERRGLFNLALGRR